MRRWELVGGGSAKFWEAAVDGALVTVRYGRMGAEGRLQEKELGSAEAASAHFGKLVAEKERKGYLEVGSSAPQPPEPAAAVVAAAAKPESQPEPEAPPEGALPDEDTFVLPGSWRRVLHPRRGGVRRGVAVPAPDATDQVQERIAAELDWIEQVLAAQQANPALVKAARAYLAGKPDPLGAAVLANLVTPVWPPPQGRISRSPTRGPRATGRPSPPARSWRSSTSTPANGIDRVTAFRHCASGA